MVPASQQAKAIAGAVVALISLATTIGVLAPDAFDADKVQAAVLAICSGVAAVYGVVYQISNKPPPEQSNNLDLHVSPLAVVGALWLALMLLTGCATMPQVETAEERLLLSTIGVKALAVETRVAREQGRITVEQAQTAKRNLELAHGGLVAARNALDVGDVDRASAILLGLSQALSAVRSILDGKHGDTTGDRGPGRGDLGPVGRGAYAGAVPAHQGGGGIAGAAGVA